MYRYVCFRLLSYPNAATVERGLSPPISFMSTYALVVKIVRPVSRNDRVLHGHSIRPILIPPSVLKTQPVQT
jgi:hypothetical protein